MKEKGVNKSGSFSVVEVRKIRYQVPSGYKSDSSIAQVIEFLRGSISQYLIWELEKSSLLRMCIQSF